MFHIAKICLESTFCSLELQSSLTQMHKDHPDQTGFCRCSENDLFSLEWGYLSNRLLDGQGAGDGNSEADYTGLAKV